MKAADTMSYLNDLEGRFTVASWRYCNIPLWPIIRNFLGFDLMEGDLLVPRPQNTQAVAPFMGRWKPKLNNWPGYLNASINDGKSRLIPSRRADVVFLASSVARTDYGNYSYHRICDPLVDTYQRQGVRCEHFEPLSNLDMKERWNPSVLLTEPLMRQVGRRLVADKSDRRMVGDLDGLLELFEVVEQEQGIEVSMGFEKTLRFASNLDFAKRTWVRILQHVGPQVAYTVQFYNYWGWSFIAACRELGIPTVELPHGRQDPTHHVYGNWDQCPPQGYSVLPDVFWNWSEQEAHTITEWSSELPRHRSFVGGNPLLAQWKLERERLTQRFSKEVAYLEALRSQGPLVLATPQFRIADVEPTIETICAAPSHWHWLVRLHPLEHHMISEVENALKERGCANTTVTLATKAPLYLLLGYANVHMTGYSSTTLEAKAFNVPTVASMEVAREIFPQALLEGWMEVGTSAEARIGLIKSYIDNSSVFEGARVEPVEETLERLHECILGKPLEASR